MPLYEFDILSGSLYRDGSDRLQLGPGLGHDLPSLLRAVRRANNPEQEEEESPPTSTSVRADAAAVTAPEESTVGWTIRLDGGYVLTEWDPNTDAFTNAGLYEGPVALTHVGPDWWVLLAPIEGD